jgi:hypothetical protein
MPDEPDPGDPEGNAPFGGAPFGTVPFGPRPEQEQEGAGPLTDTTILMLPINCVLHGHQKWYGRGREYDIRGSRTTFRTAGTRSHPTRFNGEPPSFTTKTDKRGYD